MKCQCCPDCPNEGTEERCGELVCKECAREADEIGYRMTARVEALRYLETLGDRDR